MWSIAPASEATQLSVGSCGLLKGANTGGGLPLPRSFATLGSYLSAPTLIRTLAIEAATAFQARARLSSTRKKVSMVGINNKENPRPYTATMIVLKSGFV